MTQSLLLAILAAAILAGCSPPSAGPTSDAAKATDDVIDAGIRHLAGEGTPVDSRLALDLFGKAAAMGDPRGQFNQGWLYLRCIGVRCDRKKGLELLLAAAERGDPFALYSLDTDASMGLPSGIKHDPEWSARARQSSSASSASITFYERASERGNRHAQYLLSVAYREGLGAIQKETPKSLAWQIKSAEAGYAPAQYHYGRSFYGGEPLPEDRTKFIEWVKKAADQGYAPSQLVLGLAYANGIGVGTDARQAALWLQKAADQGYADAELALADGYKDGLGEGKALAKDPTMAFTWYLKAANQASSEAQGAVARALHGGEGTPKDFARAADWTRLAAAQGHPPSQSFLGWLYERGEGVPQDRVLAYAYYNLAASSSETAAEMRVYRDRLELQLTSAERAEAQSLSSDWKSGALLQRKSSAEVGSHASGPLRSTGRGTAFMVSSSGHAVTNQHVVDGCREVRVASGQRAQVVTTDDQNDLALLLLTPGAFAPIAPATTRLKQGDEVVVYGYPLEGVLSAGGNLTPGVVSALTGLQNNSGSVQITAPIQPGSSGSPLLDRKGHVVGVVSHRLSDGAVANATGTIPQNVNFAVSHQTLRAFLDAHEVEYTTGSNLLFWDKSVATIGREAKGWTLVVECWK